MAAPAHWRRVAAAGSGGPAVGGGGLGGVTWPPPAVLSGTNLVAAQAGGPWLSSAMRGGVCAWSEFAETVEGLDGGGGGLARRERCRET